MRIELKHRSSSRSYQNLRSMLEEIVAEERLPIAIETTASEEPQSTVVRIHSGKGDCGVLHHDIHIAEAGPEQAANSSGDPAALLEKLRNAVLEKWNDYATNPLSHLI